MQKKQKKSGPKKVKVVKKQASRGPIPTTPIKARSPTINSSANCLTISHSEVFGNASFPGQATFEISSGYRVNPALSDCFPWLAGIGNHYESYKFTKLSFRYITRSNYLAVGSIGLVFDHDPIDPAPHNLLEACSYHEKSVELVSKDQTLHIDLTNDTFPRRYTRPGDISSEPDLKTYDLGNLYVFGDGLTSGPSTPGLLEVTYTVVLSIPQLEHDVAGSLTNSFLLTPTSLIGSPTTITQNANAVMPFKATDASSLTFTQDWSGTITGIFQSSGQYLGECVAAATNTVFGGVSAHLASAAATMAVFALRARKGDVFRPMLTGVNNPTVATWKWSQAAYEQVMPALD